MPERPLNAWRPLALSGLAGLALLAAFPPVGLWWAAPVGMAALFAALRRQSVRGAMGYGFVCYLVVFLPLLEWTRFLGPVPWLLLAVLQATIAALLGPLVVAVERAVVGRRWGPALRVVGLVGAVIAVEAVRARLPFGGLTWGRLAFGQSEGPLLSWAALGGAPLVGAAVTVTGIGLLEAVRRLPRRGTAGGLAPRPFALSVALLLVPALAALAVPTPVDGPPVQVAAVQGNVPGQGLEAFDEDLVVLDNHLRQTEQLAADVAAGRTPRPDLVIWPENASDQDPRRSPPAAERLDAAVEALGGQSFLFGAILRDGARSINALAIYGPGGIEGPVYAKRHLVPFGEYLPLRSLVERVYPAARTLLPRDYSPGNMVGLLELGGVPIAVGSCFEVAFDDLPRAAVRAGGQLLVLPSNNASYGRSSQSAQQLAMARLRAVEHGRSTVVATTSGISALVLPDGVVVARSGLFEAAVLTAELPRRTTLTVATRYGDRVEQALAALLLLPVLAGLRRRGGAEPAQPQRHCADDRTEPVGAPIR